MSSRYSDDKRTHKHYRVERERNRNQHDQNHRSRSRSRSRSKSPDYRQRYSSSSSSSGGYGRTSHHREMNSDRNGLSSVYGRKDEHKSRDADDLVCPPPPVISKMPVSIGKLHGPAKPVQMKLSTTKPHEPVKKLTVASAFSNNDSSDDDEEEDMPVKYSRNIGRDTPTSSGPNSFGKTKQGFCDVKKIFEKSLRDFNNE